MLSGENTGLSGASYISGDLLVPGTPTLKTSGGAKTVGTLSAGGSAQPSNYSVSLSGSALLRYLVRQMNPVAMPVVAAPPASSHNVSLSGNAAPLTLASGNYGSVNLSGSTSIVLGVSGATTPAVYTIQSLSLTGASVLKVVGPVALTVGNGGVTFNGTIGSSAHPEWLLLAVSGGNINLNGNTALYGSLLAPLSQVTVGSSSSVYGTVTCSTLIMSGAGLVDPTGP